MENRSSLQYIADFYSGAQKTTQPSTNSKGVFARRQAKSQPKMGKMCPACGLMRSLSGSCDCNTF